MGLGLESAGRGGCATGLGGVPSRQGPSPEPDPAVPAGPLLTLDSAWNARDGSPHPRLRLLAILALLQSGGCSGDAGGGLPGEGTPVWRVQGPPRTSPVTGPAAVPRRSTWERSSSRDQVRAGGWWAPAPGRSGGTLWWRGWGGKWARARAPRQRQEPSEPALTGDRAGGPAASSWDWKPGEVAASNWELEARLGVSAGAWGREHSHRCRKGETRGDPPRSTCRCCLAVPAEALCLASTCLARMRPGTGGTVPCDCTRLCAARWLLLDSESAPQSYGARQGLRELHSAS